MLTQAKMIVAIRQWIFMQIQILMNTIKETKLKRRFVSSSDSRRCLVSILHIFLVKNCIVWPLIQQFSWNLLTLTRDELYANDTNSNMNYLSFHFIDVSPLCESDALRTRSIAKMRNERGSNIITDTILQIFRVCTFKFWKIA